MDLMSILIISYSHSNQPSVATQQQVRGFQGFGIFPDSRLPPPKIEPQQSLLLGIMSNDSTVFFWISPRMVKTSKPNRHLERMIYGCLMRGRDYKQRLEQQKLKSN